MSQGILKVLVGLPGSGKSTLANKMGSSYGDIILSSDEIRKELFNDVNEQEDNNKVFQTLYNRADDYLNQGKNVIIDATNISRKRRMHMLNHVLKPERSVAYYLNTYIDEAFMRNTYRDRSVPHEVISRMFRDMHIPVVGEGFDNVIYVNEEENQSFDSAVLQTFFDDCSRSGLETFIKDGGIHTHDVLLKAMERFIPEFELINDVPHDSNYHTKSISEHTYLVYKDIYDNYEGDGRYELLWASMMHDLGKGVTKSFYNHKGERRDTASYIGHENVSAQLTCYYLNKFGFSDRFVDDVTTLVQFHMYPMKAGEKKMKQVRNIIGDRLYDLLLVLHEADKQAK